MRYDFGINDALKVTEKVTEKVTNNCDETVFIVEEFPEIDYVLAYRGGKFQPWVAAWGYNGKNAWSQGHYFADLMDAIEYIRTKQGKINYYRMDEIATKTIDKLIENDPYEAEEFFKEELDLDDEEIEYFCIRETINEEEWI